MNDELKPAILVLKKRSAGSKYFFFEDHRTALDFGSAMAEDGWKWMAIAPTIYRADEIPDVLARTGLYDRDLFGEG